jgi:hypothetical protein
MEIGCIDQRRLVVAISVRNRTKDKVTLLSLSPVQLGRSIERVAVQFALLPQVPANERSPILPSLRWSRSSRPLLVPAGRDAWVQSSFLMRHCSTLSPGLTQTVNRTITLRFRVGGRDGTETISPRATRIFLTRGPAHPSVPINHTG